MPEELEEFKILGLDRTSAVLYIYPAVEVVPFHQYYLTRHIIAQIWGYDWISVVHAEYVTNYGA